MLVISLYDNIRRNIVDKKQKKKPIKISYKKVL